MDPTSQLNVTSNREITWTGKGVRHELVWRTAVEKAMGVAKAILDNGQATYQTQKPWSLAEIATAHAAIAKATAINKLLDSQNRSENPTEDKYTDDRNAFEEYKRMMNQKVEDLNQTVTRLKEGTADLITRDQAQKEKIEVLSVNIRKSLSCWAQANQMVNSSQQWDLETLTLLNPEGLHPAHYVVLAIQECRKTTQLTIERREFGAQNQKQLLDLTQQQNVTLKEIITTIRETTHIYKCHISDLAENKKLLRDILAIVNETLTIQRNTLEVKNKEIELIRANNEAYERTTQIWLQVIALKKQQIDVLGKQKQLLITTINVAEVGIKRMSETVELAKGTNQILWETVEICRGTNAIYDKMNERCDNFLGEAKVRMQAINKTYDRLNAFWAKVEKEEAEDAEFRKEAEEKWRQIKLKQKEEGITLKKAEEKAKDPIPVDKKDEENRVSPPPVKVKNDNVKQLNLHPLAPWSFWETFFRNLFHKNNPIAALVHYLIRYFR